MNSTETEPAREMRTTETTRQRTLGEISHTNPYTGESFGAAMVYERGPTVAADGGAPGPTDEREDRTDAETSRANRLKDVDHTPPDGDGANRVHERGGEHDASDGGTDRVDNETDGNGGTEETV